MTFPSLYAGLAPARPDGRTRAALGHPGHRADRGKFIGSLRANTSSRWSPSGRGLAASAKEVADGSGSGERRSTPISPPTPRSTTSRRRRTISSPGSRPALDGGQARAGGEADRAERGGGVGDRGAGRRTGRSAPRRCGRSTSELRRDPSAARRRRTRRRAHGAGRPRRVVPRHPPHPAPRPGRGCAARSRDVPARARVVGARRAGADRGDWAGRAGRRGAWAGLGGAAAPRRRRVGDQHHGHGGHLEPGRAGRGRRRRSSPTGRSSSPAIRR